MSGGGGGGVVDEVLLRPCAALCFPFSLHFCFRERSGLCSRRISLKTFLTSDGISLLVLTFVMILGSILLAFFGALEHYFLHLFWNDWKDGPC